MAQMTLKCPSCGSENVVRYGRSITGGQRYYCRDKNCEVKTFRLDYKYTGCKKRIDEILTLVIAPVKKQENERIYQVRPI